MDKLSREAGMTIPKGAGPHVDEAAAKLIINKGEGALRTFTKLHFANTQKRNALLNGSGHNKKLAEWGLTLF